MNTVDYNKLRLVVRNQLLGFSLINSTHYNDCLRAANFAEQWHTGIRKDGITKEFYHQYSIAAFFLNLIPIIKSRVVDSDIIISKILIGIFLHDTYEDYPESNDKLKINFPEDYELVRSLSKIHYHGLQKIKMTDNEYYKILSEDPVTILIKAIDRIHNLSTIRVLGEAKVKQYIEHTEAYVLPMLKYGRNNYFEYNTIFEHLKSVINITCQALE